jgi:hypothetical protein
MLQQAFVSCLAEANGVRSQGGDTGEGGVGRSGWMDGWMDLSRRMELR